MIRYPTGSPNRTPQVGAPGRPPSLIAILKKVDSGFSGRFFRAADDLSARRYFGASGARARARVFFLPFPVRGNYASG